MSLASKVYYDLKESRMILLLFKHFYYVVEVRTWNDLIVTLVHSSSRFVLFFLFEHIFLLLFYFSCCCFLSFFNRLGSVLSQTRPCLVAVELVLCPVQLPLNSSAQMLCKHFMLLCPNLSSSPPPALEPVPPVFPVFFSSTYCAHANPRLPFLLVLSSAS